MHRRYGVEVADEARCRDGVGQHHAYPAGRLDDLSLLDPGVDAARTNDDLAGGLGRIDLAAVAGKHGLTTDTLQGFVDTILGRMVFDGEQLTDLLAPLELGWRQRREKELALMDDLLPLLKKLAGEREISGLNAYEQ